MRRLIVAAFLCLCSSFAYGQSQNQAFPGSGNAGYPPGAVPAVGAGTGTVGAVSASISGVAGQFSFLCGFSASILENGTGNTTSGPVIVTGLSVGNTFTYQLATQGPNIAFLFTQTFTPCLAGGSVASAISVNTTANAQAAAVDVNAWGYRQ
jgi:hypothetical protein